MRKALFLTLIFNAAIGFSQDINNCSLSGKITDSKSGLILPGASVYIIEKNIGVTTDENGMFHIKNLEKGLYNLNISYIGYSKIEQKIELSKNQHLILNFSLNDTSFSIKSIEIIAERVTNNRFFQEPQRIEKIEAKTIELAPVRSVPELLGYSSGVTLSNQLGIFSSSAVVTLRGMPSNDQSRTLVLLDGVPLNKSDQGSVNWNRIDKNNIERIKITKGPGPAKFGSGAMGGVIELTSKKPQKKIEGSVETEYGTYNTKKLGINLGGIVKTDSINTNQFYWRLNGFARESDGYITEISKFIEVEDTFLAPVYLKEYNTFASVGYHFKNNQIIELQAGFFDDKRGNGIKVFEDLGAYSTHQTLNFTGTYSGQYDYFKWNSKLFSNQEHFIKQYESMSEGEYRLYEANALRNDFGTNTDFTITKLKKHEIETGFSYKQGSVDGSDIYFTSTDVITNKGKMDNYAIYLQDTYRFLKEKMQVNVGIRYDFAVFHNSFFQIEEPSYSLEFYKKFETTSSLPNQKWEALNPRLFLQYTFSDQNRIYASVAKGFRAPILDDMTRNGKKRGTFKIANPNLKPEHLTSIEIGGDAQLAKNLTTAVAAFYSIGENFMYIISTGDSVNMGYRLAPLLMTQNISKVIIYGTEFELKFKPTDNITLFANAAYTIAQIKEHLVANPKVDSSLTNKYLTDVPDYKLGGGISWKNDFINFSILYKYLGKTWVNDMNSVDKEIIKNAKYPDYSIVSIKLDHTFKNHLNINLSIENLFDKIYITSNAQRNPGRIVTGAIKLYF